MDKEKREALERAFAKRRREEQRERIATAVLPALISKRDFPSLNEDGCVDFLTSLAVAYADELISKLEQTKSS
jgi:hypothetical protein